MPACYAAAVVRVLTGFRENLAQPHGPATRRAGADVDLRRANCVLKW